MNIRKRKKEKGITLIALVVTIVVLLILAGVSINLVVGQNGIINKAQDAKKDYEQAKKDEDAALQGMDSWIDEQIEGTTIPDFKIRCTTEVISGVKGRINVAVEPQPITPEEFSNIIAKRPIEETEKDVLNFLKMWEGGGPTEEELKQEAQSEGITYEQLLVQMDAELEYPVYLTTGETRKINDVTRLKNILMKMEGVNSFEEFLEVRGYTTQAEYNGEVEQVGNESIVLKNHLMYITQGNNQFIVSLTCAKDGITISNRIGKNYFENLENGDYVVKASFEKKTVEQVVNVSGVEVTDWNELSELSKLISNDSSINNRTDSVTKTVNGKQVTLNVGDLKNVKYNGELKIVRVLGFNHDELTSTSAYGSQTATGKAGISFEFVDFLGQDRIMNSTNTNAGGWATTEMRTFLEGTEGISKLSNQVYIKQVKKKYIPTYNVASIQESNDKLWLLSCSEVFNAGFKAGGYGYAITKEGEQYNYYTKCTDAWSATSDYRKKPNTSEANWWWLRSPNHNSCNLFCTVSYNGYANNNGANLGNGVTPGFSI